MIDTVGRNIKVSKQRIPFGAEGPSLLGHEAGHHHLPVAQEPMLLYEGVYAVTIIELLGPDIQAALDVAPMEILVAHIQHARRFAVLPARLQADQSTLDTKLMGSVMPCAGGPVNSRAIRFQDHWGHHVIPRLTL